MSESSLEQDHDATPAGEAMTPPLAPPLEADEADAAEQAADVPIDEDEYR